MSNTGTDRIGAMFVFCASLILIFGLLITGMTTYAPEILYSGKTYRNPNIPSDWSKDELEGVDQWLNHTVTYPAILGNYVYYDYPSAIPPQYLRVLWWHNIVSVDSSTIQLQDRGMHLGSYWITSDLFDWISNDTGQTDLSKTLAIQYWDSATNKSYFPDVRAPYLKVKVWLSDHITTRNNISQSWSDGNLTIAVGFNQMDAQTGLNAWNLIGNLLAFQTPQAFGLTGIGATLLNAIIAIPIWACIGYLIFRFLMMIKPDWL